MSIVFIAPDRTMAEEYRRVLSAVPGKIEVVEKPSPLRGDSKGGRRYLSRAAGQQCF
jgi:hypothetical protein